MYSEKLAPAIRTIREASMSVRADADRNTVWVGMLPAFAANWLLPRLHRFFASHRGINVEFDTSMHPLGFENGEIDIAIRLGMGNWSSLNAEHLLDATIYPVCSPDLQVRGYRLKSLDDIVKCPLLGLSNEPELWQHWLHEAGIPQLGTERFANFSDCHLLYESAASGLGVAIALDALVEPYIHDGRLVPVSDIRLIIPKKFYLVSRPPSRQSAPVRSFRSWLKGEAMRSRSSGSIASHLAIAKTLRRSIDVPSTTATALNE
jgi:LysR family glycine cleavage system transcriptional activator